MVDSVFHPSVQETISRAKTSRVKAVNVDGHAVHITSPFPSPVDWRDHWIYFLMVDRFNNTIAPPKRAYDAQVGEFQGGSFRGIREKLPYLKQLGVGAIWLTPVLKNCQFIDDTFHGYGIQDFLNIEARLAEDSADPEGELQTLIDEAHARGIYIIFDIVLNHAGDVFAYEKDGQTHAALDFKPQGYPVQWRKDNGKPNPAWHAAPQTGDPQLTSNAAVRPDELRHNTVFRQKGKGGEAGGDFESLKEMVTARDDVRTALIRVFQYLIAKFDVDGFRIDTLKFIERDFARIFGNAVREFALSIGKKNFFTFGEIFDDEHKIAQFIGRQANDSSDLVGVDAALDFPLFFKLPSVCKGFMPPVAVDEVFELRKNVQRGTISSHGDASKYFVSFLDNHDMNNRIYYRDPAHPNRYSDQVSLAITCMFTLQGIPCLYYGTEQGLSGSGSSDRAVREALWGTPRGFDQNHPFYNTIASIARCRAEQPALRYGRQYFRPLSGDRHNFGPSSFDQGILAYSRILTDQELIVVANTHQSDAISVYVLVDYNLNQVGEEFCVDFSNVADPEPAGPVNEIAGARLWARDGSNHSGTVRACKVHLNPMEAQILVPHNR